jgi:glutaminyl-peptide cyclotransferase
VLTGLLFAAGCGRPASSAGGTPKPAETPTAPAATPTSTPTPTPTLTPPRREALRVRVVRSFPHDPEAFTQGLLLHKGKLYESTGLPGHSSLRRVDLATGRVDAKVDLEYPLFGEGLALVGNELYQITWQEGRALVWDLASFQKRREYRYRGEGWGLCYDGGRLIMSDGSDQLVFRDPQTFRETGRVSVRHDGRPLRLLNELECVGDGVVFANVWQEQALVRIDPATGHTTAWIDASGLLSPEEARGADVLNGIAYLPGAGRLLITGKYWPKVFEVELVPAPKLAR